MPCIAFTIAYFLRILHSSDPPLAANLAFEAIQRTLPVMQQVGFQEDLVSQLRSSPIVKAKLTGVCLWQYEEFLAPLLELIQGFAPEDEGAPTSTEWSLIQALQDAERSNCIVVVSPARLPLICSSILLTRLVGIQS